ncbi:ArsR family transcriptional regulator [Leptospira ognonensis]|uniref:ArsR family transcriptional regulator n=1 Tax=Leptospira ognonensis TaxID=2484945 RepID=A0A4R9JVJ4_9LEPT|nr:winged helix-turn-helix domain-containing protein [Leptospira ognonensis]TGL56980.1 ArsR family transcriptional regulator [Leptospira ognonensis]
MQNKNPKNKLAITKREPIKWTFLSNHAHVLICLYYDPEIRVRDIAQAVGITERTVLGIIKDLVEAEILEKIKEGRRNHYKIIQTKKLRHSLEANHTIKDLLKLAN